MPDPNPITLSTVDRLAPLTLQLARSGLQSLLRNGDVVQARVVAMLTKDVAQLEILGKTIDVSTSQALKAGATISVAINRTGRSLELVIRRDTNDARAAPTPQSAGVAGRGYVAPSETTGSLQAVLASIEDRVLAAQAAINEAVPSAETNLQSANIASAPSATQLAMKVANFAAGIASQQPQAEIQASYEQETKFATPASGQDHGPSSRSLELVIRPNTDGTPPAPPPQLLGFARGYVILGKTSEILQPGAASIEDPLLAARAAMNEAVLSETSSQSTSVASAPPSLRQVHAAYSETGFAPQAQMQAEIRARYELARPLAPEVGEQGDPSAPSSADEASPLAQQQALSSPAPDQRAPNSAFAIQVPFQLPQMQQPILMRIEEEDENEARRGGRGSAKRWTVNFSLDAGTLGPVHVSIGLSASALSVRLSSGAAESASLLGAWLPELKTALEQADFAVEDLSAARAA